MRGGHRRDVDTRIAATTSSRVADRRSAGLVQDVGLGALLLKIMVAVLATIVVGLISPAKRSAAA
ncbi:hypothetical protein [Bradyrhizobium septentrionale]|uniref:Uncharacterized protein n=1 Tax=Bradyrhizobium septentrionale TaxID=1404411 RepID=A0A973VVR5_9BRAD|nr:hypothetical protein [Bradyrhizobium septentrionale]UGY19831.1 hypothetical protein HAP48_0021625 [Bradyrhizobium septentrionale]UGY28614.1 hypothetical protein HU675_0018620 [Bradyrhizobium septentrionale]